MSAALRPRIIGAALAFFVLFASMAAPSCAEGPSDLRASAPRPPIPYAGRAAELFDNGIEPAAVGYLANEVTEPDAEEVLRERIQTADDVVRARVVTLTSQASEHGWLVGLHPLETLSGRAPLGDVTLEVSATDRADGLLRAYQDRMVGMTVVAFLRGFAGGVDGSTLHFHLAVDTPAERKAVRAAALLAEVH